MTSIEELRENRLAKIKNLESLGINPYPASVSRNNSINEVISDFDRFSSDNGEGKTVSVVGRIISLRGQGKLIFVDLFDGTGKIQALLKSDQEIKYSDDSADLEIENGFEIFQDNIDESDFVKVSGIPFTSKRGEKTILVSEWMIVVKSLRPVPDSFYGLKDEDERYRKRYLDILLNEEIRNRIVKKSLFWNTIRVFLLERNFVEVETPVLETTTGGAEAEPFVTHHNSLDMDVYLRISAGELWQKKLLVSGLPKIFEIGRIFRNEGMSSEHLQDYTQLEFYEAYSDYQKGMKMVVEMYREIADKVFGTRQFEMNDHQVDFDKDWEKYDYVKIIEEKFGINVLDSEVDDLIKKLEEEKIKFDPKTINKERATDLLWKVCRKEITGPGFLINVPIFMEPLAKKSANNDQTVERFQIIMGGSELGKGFSELNDPIDQNQRFLHQEELRKEGDSEAQMKDESYVEAMEYGMPPAFGFGVSERLFALMSGVSVREAQIFPLMKPKEE